MTRAGKPGRKEGNMLTRELLMTIDRDPEAPTGVVVAKAVKPWRGKRDK